MTDLAPAAAYSAIFEGSDLLGPGGEAETRALARAMGLSPGQRVLELGGGTGRAACQLAREHGVHVTLLENAPAFAAAARARAAALPGRVEVREADMRSAPDLFPPETFDAVFSEGAIYNVGLEAGARIARRLLRPQGVLGLTDLCWTVPPEQAPAPVRAFWDQEAPGILGPIDAKLALLRTEDFDPVTSFVLPSSAWDRFYAPVRENLRRLRAAGVRSPVFDAFDEELRIYDAGGRDVVGYAAIVALTPRAPSGPAGPRPRTGPATSP